MLWYSSAVGRSGVAVCNIYNIIEPDYKNFLYLLLGVTIVAKNDYCDSNDIAGKAIAILLRLWTTIAILL